MVDRSQLRFIAVATNVFPKRPAIRETRDRSTPMLVGHFFFENDGPHLFLSFSTVCMRNPGGDNGVRFRDALS